MSEDRAILAVLVAYAPTPLELANRFDIEFTILPTDDFGQIIENNESKVTYSAAFNLDANSAWSRAQVASPAPLIKDRSEWGW